MTTARSTEGKVTTKRVRGVPQSISLQARVGPEVRTFTQEVVPAELEQVATLQAETHLYKQVIEARNDLDTERAGKGWPTCRQWYKHWFRQRYVLARWSTARKRGSEENAVKHWRLVDGAIGDLPMDRITSPIIIRTLNELKKTKSPNYLRVTHWFLNILFMDAIRFGFDDGDGVPPWRARWNPMEAVMRPKRAETERVILSDQMLGELVRRSVEAHKDEKELPYETCAIGLQVLLGLRVSEATMLRWEQIRLDGRLVEGSAGTITWKPGERKHGRPFIVAIPMEALPFIPTARQERVGLVWRDGAAPNHRLEAVNAELRARGAEMGLPTEHLTSHSLRHSFAFSLMRAGQASSMIQRAMGHGSVRTTEVYLRSQEVTQAAAHNTAQVVLPRAKLLLGAE